MAKRRKRRRLKITAKHRYIYIMKRASDRSAYARATLQTEYKIGISKDPAIRQKQVDKAIQGRVDLIRTYFCRDALRLEKHMHHIFRDSRFRITTVGKGGGETEWFYMSGFEYLALEVAMWMGWTEQLVKPTIYSIIIIILIYSYGQKVFGGH